MFRNKYEDEVNTIKKSIKAIKTAQKKAGVGASTGVTLHNGEPRNEVEVLEEKLEVATKKLDNLEMNAPDLMDIKVPKHFSL